MHNDDNNISMYIFNAVTVNTVYHYCCH